MKMKTAVLVHGSHLQANLNGQTWADINFGCEEGKPSLKGRLLMGIKVARDIDADLILYGTGVIGENGITEAEYSLTKTLQLEDSIADILHFTKEEKTSFKEWVYTRTELDTKSQTTVEECRNNIDRCMEKGIDRLILVSSPWHIQRCLVEAFNYAEILRNDGKTPPEILGTASYGSTEGVLVLEPPHRGDRPRTRWHDLARLFFTVPEEKIPEFEKKLETLVTSESQT
jgi:hypothetical protein